MAKGHHRFGAGFAPLHGTTNLLRNNAEQQLFGVCANLCAKATTDIRCQNVHEFFVNTIRRSDGLNATLSVLS